MRTPDRSDRGRLYQEAAQRLRAQLQHCEADALGHVQWDTHLPVHPDLAVPLANWLDGAAAAWARKPPATADPRFVPPTALAYALLDWVPTAAEARIAAIDPPRPGPRR